MTATIHEGALPAGAAPASAARARRRSIPRPRPELIALLVLAAVLNLWGLSKNGFANDYYAAAVRSMASSWHDFFYGSLDKAGVMTVDKPPLALWVQALSARIFGMHSLSLLVPQALMGVGSVALVYDLTRRLWGRIGGFAGGAALALTPITVAISRHNNPDAAMILCVVAALWALVRALQDGRTRWLVLCGACVGLGFEAKMGAALLVVPGIVAAWLWVAPRGRIAALRSLAAGAGALLVVGGAWPLLMLLTPAADRPFISGTSDNSILSLIFGYNGLGRLDGQSGGPGGGGFGGGPGGVFGGGTGVTRLLGESLGGQAGWLLGMALVGGIALLAISRLRRDARSGWLLGVGGAFLVTAVAFSAAKGIFHPYYTSELAPFTAMLIGAVAGHVALRRRSWRLVGALAIAGGVGSELAVLHSQGTLSWLVPLLLVVGVAVVAGALLVPSRLARIALATGLIALAIAPASWAVQTLGYATSSTFPSGGPQSAGVGGPGGGGPGGGFGGRGMGAPGLGGSATGGGATGPGGATGGGTAGNGSTGPGGTTGNGATVGAQGGPPVGGVQSGGANGQGFAGGGPGVPPAAAQGRRGSGQGFSSGQRGSAGAGPGGFGDDAGLQSVLSYVKAHGGGTIGVSSQTTAAGAILSSDADVAGLGGFSGRESSPSLAWFADAVAAGKLRWVYSGGGGFGAGGGFGGDDRAGASAILSAAASTCKAVGSVSGLYDCQGYASALRSAAS